MISDVLNLDFGKSLIRISDFGSGGPKSVRGFRISSLEITVLGVEDPHVVMVGEDNHIVVMMVIIRETTGVNFR